MTVPNRALAVVESMLNDGTKRAAQAEEEAWVKAGPLKLGRVWRVSEEFRDSQGFHWRIAVGLDPAGESKAFDAMWHKGKTNGEEHDTLEVESAEHDHASV